MKGVRTSPSPSGTASAGRALGTANDEAQFASCERRRADKDRLGYDAR